MPMTCCLSKSNETRNMNEFPIHDASREGDLCRVRQLIEAGVNVDSLNEEGQTPLHLAVRYGQNEVAGLLINSKCNINQKDHYGRTPLIWAAVCVSKNKGIVDIFLHRGAQIDFVDDDRRTLLHQVSYPIGWMGIVHVILDNGEVDLNAVDHDGSTSPMLAALIGNEEVSAVLIEAGADINTSDDTKSTALHCAAEFGHKRVIQILLEKEGLDLNPQDVDGNTPLHLACQDTYCREAMKQLLDAGADTNVKNKLGRTALSEGIWYLSLSHKEIWLFVQKGAFLEEFDYEFMSLEPFLKENVLKDVELCTQSVVNKFNRQSLPALYSIAYFARRLPNVDNFKLGARAIEEVENLVKCEIARNTFCNVVKVRPISLSALCVLSLITCKSGKKRAAFPDFGHSKNS